MEKKPLVAVVDDESDILELIARHLEKSGFEVKAFLQARPLLNFLQHHLPDIIILDLMLPDGDGLEICKMLKADERLSSVPILILTAKSEEVDIVLGLEFGADDYLVKPFSPKELLARIKAILRRTQTESREKKSVVRLGDLLTIDLDQHLILVNNQKVDLTLTEFSILRLLSQKTGWVFSREKILDHLWGDDKSVLDRTVDVHIRNLREKLGPAGRLIKNIRGVGYKIEP